MNPTRALALALAGAVAATFAGACYDPVHADAVAQLGPEVAGVPEGLTHRAGQPCTTCHGGDGPGDPTFSVAGTIYRVRGGTDPMPNATVIVIDATGTTKTVTTNEVGNFRIEEREWAPTFPLRVEVEAEGARRTMVTPIGRNGGCATCHRGAGSSSQMPGVYLKEK